MTVGGVHHVVEQHGELHQQQICFSNIEQSIQFAYISMIASHLNANLKNMNQ